MQGKLTDQGRKNAALEKENEELKKWKEEKEAESLTEEEKRQKELEDLRKAKEESEAKAVQAEVTAHIASLAAKEEEHPEIKHVIDFISGDSVENAEAEVNRFFKEEEMFEYDKSEWMHVYAEDERKDLGYE